MVRNDDKYRDGYIGGSDMSFVYGSYETEGFKLWWKEKLTGLRARSFQNSFTKAGNILEDEILNAVVGS